MRSFASFRGLMVTLVMAGCSAKAPVRLSPAVTSARPTETDDATLRSSQLSLAMLSQQTQDYRIGPGDLLEISIFEWELREEAKTAAFRVAESGVISLPVVGEMNVAGRTVTEVKKQVEDNLRQGGFLLQPRVGVDITEYRSRRIAVVGAVNDPGVYTLRQNVSTLLEVLSLAGGLTDRAGDVAYVVRTMPGSGTADQGVSSEQLIANARGGQRQEPTLTIDLYELLERGDLELNMVLQHGDFVNVPEARRFAVIGYVNGAGSFPIKRPTTVLDAVAMAGGMRDGQASPGAGLIRRVTETGPLLLPVDIDAIAAGRAPNMYMHADDVLYIRRTGARQLLEGILDFARSILNIGISVRTIN